MTSCPEPARSSYGRIIWRILGAWFNDAADSGDEEEWSGEEGGGASRRSSAPMGADARSALLRGKRRMNLQAAAFAAEEAKVSKKYTVLYATGHTKNRASAGLGPRPGWPS